MNAVKNFFKTINDSFESHSGVRKPIGKQEMNKIIEEIHETFYTEVDRLLEHAKISKSLDTDMQDLIDKRNALVSLGFNSTKEVQYADTEIKRLNEIRAENIRNADLVEAINYFSFKYPHYKFISEDSVKKICEKYGLKYSKVDRYIGTVPDKNVQDMKNFKIDASDECYYEEFFGFRTRDISYFSFEQMKARKEREYAGHIMRYTLGYTEHNKCQLEIAAPKSDFNLENMEEKDSQLIEILDPVVLKPVFFKGKKHYLVVTAWGLEASDELVVNQRNN